VSGIITVTPQSRHLYVCLALFISLAKRRHELLLLADGAASHRPILGEYTPYLLDQMIAVVTASTLVAYVFYTISPETEQKFGTHWLGLTIPFPIYGIFPAQARAESRFSVGYQGFAGFMIPVASRLAIEAEFKYSVGKGDPGEAFEGFEDFDLGGYQISLGVNYWF